MNDLEMRTFLEVVRTGTMSLAAERLYVSPSAVSRRLDELENRIGTRLLDRGRGVRTVTLTQAGQRLLVIAERWEELVAEAMLVRNERTSVVIGGSSSICHYLLQPFLHELTRHVERLQPRIRIAEEDVLYIALARHEVHIAFGSIRSRSDLDFMPLVEEPMVAVRGLRPGDAKGITTVDVATLDPGEQLFIRWGQPYLRWHRERWGHRQAAIHISNASLAPGMLMRSNTWAIVPVSMAWSMLDSGIQISKLSDPPPRRKIYMVTPKSVSESIREELEIVRQSIEATRSAIKQLALINHSHK